MGVFSKASELSKNYDVDKKVLGSGNFATVKKCVRKSDKEVFACKTIDKAKVEDMEDIEREIDIMGKIDHQNTIKLVEIFEEKKQTHLIMELVTGGELFDTIVEKGSFTAAEAASCTKALCSALKYLHGMEIVHRDLKPENLLLKDPEKGWDRAKKPADLWAEKLKVADFGLARMIKNNDLMKTACGTPGYVAPEVLQNKGYSSGAVDMWSTGVILYILLCGFPPFYEEELPALFEQILKARYDFPSPWWDSVPESGKNLVKAFLVIDPKKRMTAKGAMDHKFLSENAQSELEKCSVDTGELKKHQATRKMQKVAKKIMAMNRLKNLTAAAKAAE